jgi:hypothetical protein
MKMENSLRPQQLHILLKQIEETRRTRQNEQRSKSPSNLRSRSGGKAKIEQKTQSQKDKNKSERRLSLTIGNTLKKMDYLKLLQQDDEENMVYPSASTRPHLTGPRISSVSEIELSKDDIERFSIAAGHNHNNTRFKIDMQSGDSLQ